MVRRIGTGLRNPHPPQRHQAEADAWWDALAPTRGQGATDAVARLDDLALFLQHESQVALPVDAVPRNANALCQGEPTPQQILGFCQISKACCHETEIPKAT